MTLSDRLHVRAADPQHRPRRRRRPRAARAGPARALRCAVRRRVLRRLGGRARGARQSRGGRQARGGRPQRRHAGVRWRAVSSRRPRPPSAGAADADRRSRRMAERASGGRGDADGAGGVPPLRAVGTARALALPASGRGARRLGGIAAAGRGGGPDRRRRMGSAHPRAVRLVRAHRHPTRLPPCGAGGGLSSRRHVSAQRNRDDDPSYARIAQALGFATEPDSPSCDLAIVGGGPAGLAAAVYGASEGRSTIIVARRPPSATRRRSPRPSGRP
jgi:FAD binding domain